MSPLPSWAPDPFIRKEMAPKSGFGPGHQHLPPDSLPALTPASSPLRPGPSVVSSLLCCPLLWKRKTPMSSAWEAGGPCAARSLPVPCKRRQNGNTTYHTVTHELSANCFPGVVCGMGLSSKTMTPDALDRN